MRISVPIRVKFGGFSMKQSKTGFYENRATPIVLSNRKGLSVDAEEVYSLRDRNVEATIAQFFDEAKKKKSASTI